MTLKKTEWINGNHMKIETPIKAFNRQIGGISTGNVIDDVQYSSYIRSWNDLGRDLCDNRDGTKDREPGHLTMFDLDGFTNLHNWVRRWVINHAKSVNRSFILYKFRHWNDNHEIIDGYIVTTNTHMHVVTLHAGPTHKSIGVLKECRKYICEDWETLEVK